MRLRGCEASQRFIARLCHVRKLVAVFCEIWLLHQVSQELVTKSHKHLPSGLLMPGEKNVSELVEGSYDYDLKLCCGI